MCVCVDAGADVYLITDTLKCVCVHVCVYMCVCLSVSEDAGVGYLCMYVYMSRCFCVSVYGVHVQMSVCVNMCAEAHVCIHVVYMGCA